MSQRGITAVLPHQANRRYAIPNPAGVNPVQYILAVGDSLSEAGANGSAGGTSNIEPQRVAQSLDNVALGGRRLVSAPGFTEGVETLITGQLAASPDSDTVFICAGVNDMGSNNVTGITVADMQAAAQSVTAECLAAGKSVVWANVGPFKDAQSWTVPLAPEMQAEWNPWLKEYCGANALPLVDLYGVLGQPGDPDKMRQEYTNYRTEAGPPWVPDYDWIHYSTLGGQVAAQAVDQALLSLRNSRLRQTA